MFQTNVADIQYKIEPRFQTKLVSLCKRGTVHRFGTNNSMLKTIKEFIYYIHQHLLQDTLESYRHLIQMTCFKVDFDL